VGLAAVRVGCRSGYGGGGVPHRGGVPGGLIAGWRVPPHRGRFGLGRERWRQHDVEIPGRSAWGREAESGDWEAGGGPGREGFRRGEPGGVLPAELK
jgi:hypothetical protein